MDEIARLSALQGAEINEAKKILATEITAMLHGREAALAAQETARQTFEEGKAGGELPTLALERERLKSGIGLLSLIVEAGLAPSNAGARRHVQGSAIRLNDVLIEDDKRIVNEDDCNGEGIIKLSFGKKKHVLVTTK